MFSEKHDKEKAEKERQKQLEKENAERLAREVGYVYMVTLKIAREYLLNVHLLAKV